VNCHPSPCSLQCRYLRAQCLTHVLFHPRGTANTYVKECLGNLTTPVRHIDKLRVASSVSLHYSHGSLNTRTVGRLGQGRSGSTHQVYRCCFYMHSGDLRWPASLYSASIPWTSIRMGRLHYRSLNGSINCHRHTSGHAGECWKRQARCPNRVSNRS